jgi:ABC-2 type transport system ATP-binding protein
LLQGIRSDELEDRIDDLLALLELSYKKSEYGFSLSRGMQQKLALAIALLKDPAILLLDEPTLGLDVEASELLVAALRQLAAQGRTILLTTHHMGLAEELSERVVFLHNGEVVMDGALGQLLERGLKEAYLRVIRQARDNAANPGTEG